jgi:dihydrolipoamide dehydrogenase
MNDFNFDLIVIGSGPGGYVAAIRAAQLGLKVACVEKSPQLGGTCLNVGCIPSKTLLHSTEFLYRLIHEGKQMGIEGEQTSFNFAQMMTQKRKVITSFNEGIAALFKKNQITSLTATATFTSPTTLQVGSQELTARYILLATGSEPIQLPFLPFDEKRILSSTGALALQTPPKKLLVIGAGVIGVELGSVYSRLGSEVVFIEFLDRVCPTLDESLSKALQPLLTKQKMAFHLSSRVTSADMTSSQITLHVAQGDATTQISGDAVLVCIGRKPYTQNLGLDKAGIVPNERGFIPIDGQFRTSQPHIFAIGDIVDGPMLAHKASEEGVAVAEILAGYSPVINYLAIPNVVYTYPEVASVGLTEAEAKNFGLTLKTGQFPFKANSRARCVNEEEGFVKILADAATDRLLGVHIIGAHASELIAEAALAIQHNLTALDIANTPHAHPTLSEAIKEAALALHKRAIHR